MPLVWPQKNRSIAMETLSRAGHENIVLKYEQIFKDRAAVIPVYVSSKGNVNYEFSAFLYCTWLYFGKLKSMKTISTYAECLSDWFNYLELIDVDWRSCKVREIAAYRNWLCGTEYASEKRKKLAGRTINLRLTAVSEFYKSYWKKVGCAGNEKDLVESIGRLVVRVNKKRPKIIPTEKIGVMRRNMNHVHGLIFFWCLCTGLRIGSVLSLTERDFRQLVSSQSKFLSVKVKGGKLLEVYVPLRVIEETEKYIRLERAIRQLDRPWDRVDQLFLNSNARPVTRQGYYKAFKSAAYKAGVECSPHSTRATYASKLVERITPVCQESGLDSMKVVQTLLGHVSVETTQDYVDSISICSTNVLEAIEESLNDF
ncbi:tyrosine-type recombinase/integrase [Pseudomonas aeruginosa]|uniref:tyrosine-type recombinase/integrase n=1 Tax=Pseudomonas aeruginosa TaxID=287 RepID=UPI003D9CB7DB